MITCNVCGSNSTEIVHVSDHQPLGRYGFALTREEAKEINHDLELHIRECGRCGFAWNESFDESKVDYRDLPILESAPHSTNYRRFQQESALWLEKTVGPIKSALEIGGGDGYFMGRLAAESKIIYEPSHESSEISSEIQHIHRYFNPSMDLAPADLIVMRQVLEHIKEPADFVRALCRSQEQSNFSPDWALYLEVPSHDQTKKSARFYDFYYEHCNYFTLNSLAQLAVRCGGQLAHLSSEYNDEILRAVIRFGEATEKPSYDAARSTLTNVINSFTQAGHSISLWGASGNGISVLSQMKLTEKQIQYVIDSDSRKHGFFIPVTGQEIVSPKDQRLQDVKCIIISSQFHADEIARQARQLFGHESTRLFDLAGRELLASGSH